jgi:hypothetical protein
MVFLRLFPPSFPFSNGLRPSGNGTLTLLTPRDKGASKSRACPTETVDPP